ncbi:MAG: RNA-guided endonuclease IscB [Limnospira sp. PMC 1286.21]|uniref:RNA-guided endonuclease IscB n=1 Tax=unclassified Limnospira TaxID=2642885 RepID=UPI0028E148AE|nr:MULTISPECIES: RNA-guided endonuclease IscB [unclassified Limnospira]MDT9292734.1 RNA-guided endonuclease IscB [Limnospira sp. PMC 1295.21]MDT9328544.1 RNA-guided endonuclease IscB [Limnospira sp. PMC 1286.21]
MPNYQNYVFVVDTLGQPLSPTHPARARKLLKKGLAAVFRTYPFTIILKKTVENPGNEPSRIKLDPGASVTGIALVNQSRDTVIWAAELTHRGDRIRAKLTARRVVRRHRRCRKTRYRQARFNNRKRQEGWLAPSLKHRVETTLTWVNRLISSCPITDISMELVRFDTQKLLNPEISGVEYQQGVLFGYELREYLLTKWQHQCAYCGGQNIPLEIEHIQPKSQGGSDRVSNLAIACHKCHQKKGSQAVEQFLEKKPEILKRLLVQAKAPLKNAAAVNSTRWALFNSLKLTGLPIEIGTGGLTKYNRTVQGLPKTHWLDDADCVGKSTPTRLKIKTHQPLLMTCFGRGGRQKAAPNKRLPIRHNPLKPIKGWLTGDIAKQMAHGIGRITPSSRGSFVLTKPDKTQFSVKPIDLKPVLRRDGYLYKFS